jgi:hypothetical protein
MELIPGKFYLSRWKWTNDPNWNAPYVFIRTDDNGFIGGYNAPVKLESLQLMQSRYDKKEKPLSGIAFEVIREYIPQTEIKKRRVLNA